MPRWMQQENKTQWNKSVVHEGISAKSSCVGLARLKLRDEFQHSEGMEKAGGCLISELARRETSSYDSGLVS